MRESVLGVCESCMYIVGLNVVVMSILKCLIFRTLFPAVFPMFKLCYPETLIIHRTKDT